MNEKSIAEAFAFLDRFTNYERGLRYPYDGWSMNIERVKSLLGELHNPHEPLKFIHVAGTKGKGTTAAMIESIARSAGYKTGIFTSPHLIRLNERIKTGGREISDADIARHVTALKPVAERVDAEGSLGKLTYFEILTALAILHFAEVKADAVILETGLGGRWDATNAFDPLVSVITSISLDHTDILGNELESIAQEKAMIIKPGRPAIAAPQKQAVMAVIESRCKEVGAELIKVEECYEWNRLSMDQKGVAFSLRGKRKFEKLFVPVAGDVQMINAAVAVTVCDAIERAGFELPDSTVAKGLRELNIPGRFQVMREKPFVVIDGAHNRDSAARLANTVRDVFPGKRVIAVIGLAKDKDVEGFLAEVAPVCGSIIFTRSQTMKAAPEDRLRRAVEGFPARVLMTDRVEDAVGRAMESAGAEDVVLITGSFYVAGEAMQVLSDE